MERASSILVPGLFGLALLAPLDALANNVGINGGPCTHATIAAAAAAASSGDTLYVSPGTYSENTIALTNKDLTIASSDATCSSVTSQLVTIEPNAGQRGFTLIDSGLVLLGLTVRLANTALDGAIVHMQQSSTLGMSDTIFKQSTSGGDGGCIYAVQSIISMINGSELDRCDATNDGGGVFLDLSTMFVLGGSSIHDGSAINGAGGGVYVGGSEITIHGDVSGNDAVDGGGLYVSIKNGIHSNAVLMNSATVASNTAENRGGGVYVTGTETQIQAFDDALIQGNTADYGGGIYSVYDGGVFLNERADVIGNHAITDGGGLFASWSDRLEFVGEGVGAIQFDTNTSDGTGAGISLSGSDLDASFVTIQDNIAADGGGGLYIWGSEILPSHVVLRNVRVLDNDAIRGAGILLDASDLDMSSDFATCDTSTLGKDRFCSEIRYNLATGASSQGGGLLVRNGGTALVETTSIAFNEAGGNGGAVSVKDTGSDVTLRNTLVRSNQVGGGSAVRVESGSDLEVYSSTFTDNDTPIRFVTGSTGLFHRNIVWGNTNDAVPNGVSGNCNTTQTAAGAPVGTGNDTLDPLFDATNARSSWKLDAASPAIDACGAGPGVDLDGAARPSGAGFDKGAFEM